MELQDFLNKVREKEANKLKIIEIEVEGIGKVEFHRPSTKDLINCMKATSEATTRIETEEGKYEKNDFGAILEASKELVYNSCSLLQSEQIREEYKNLYPTDIPVEVFGITETVEIAAELMEKFSATKEIEKMENDIKN